MERSASSRSLGRRECDSTLLLFACFRSFTLILFSHICIFDFFFLSSCACTLFYRAREMAGEMAHNSSADAEVTHCVSNLVHAFSNGLSIFKRLREKRRKRKTKHKSQGDSASNAELQLSNSLRQGPRDIKERYDMCYGEKGERFARGDGE